MVTRLAYNKLVLLLALLIFQPAAAREPTAAGSKLRRHHQLPGLITDTFGKRVKRVLWRGGSGELLWLGSCLPAWLGPGDRSAARPGDCRRDPGAGGGRLLVVVDPGHGGEQRGAVGWQGIVEKEVVLQVARLLQRRLAEAEDIDVVMTRTGDETVELARRVEMANELGADVFISVHANAFTKPDLDGVETFFHSLEATGEEARRVARYENAPAGSSGGAARDTVAYILQDIRRAETLRDSSRLAHLVQARLAAALPWKNRGVMQADFIVLRGTEMPAVLLELGFLTNPADAKLLREPANHSRLADAVAGAVEEFWQLLRRKRSGRMQAGGTRP